MPRNPIDGVDHVRAAASNTGHDGAGKPPITVPELLDALRTVGAADGREAAQRWLRQQFSQDAATAARRILTGIQDDNTYLHTLPGSPLGDQMWPCGEDFLAQPPADSAALSPGDWRRARHAFIAAYLAAAADEIAASCRRVVQAAES